MRRRLGPLALGGALLALAGPARADVPVATVPCPGPDQERAFGCTELSASDGALVWSAYDATAGAYRLTARRAGVATALPVAPRRTPFDADAGRDARGRPVVTYSRCAGDPGGPSRGCAAYELVLGAAGEHRLLPGVTAPEPLHPARWGDRVALAAPARHGVRDPAVCSVVHGRCMRLPGGPRGRAGQGVRGAVIDTDLRGRRLALTWFYNPEGSSEIRRRAIIVIDDVNRPRVRTLDRAGAGGAGNAAVLSPAVTAGAVLWVHGGAACNYQSPPNLLGRYDVTSRRIRRVASGPLAAVAADGGRTYLERCGPPVNGLEPSTVAVIVRADPDPFGPSAEPDPLRAARCPAARPAAAWGAARRLGRAVPSVVPRLAVDAGGAALAGWRAPGDARYVLRRTRSGAFGRPVPVGTAFAAPQVAFGAGGEPLAAWALPGARVQVAVGGRSQVLTGPAAVDPVEQAIVALAAGPDGHAVVVWRAGAAVFAATRAPGVAFGPVVQLGVAPPVPTGPDQPVVPITEPYADFSTAPAAAIGADGRAVVAWSRQIPLSGDHDVAIAEASPGSPFATRAVGRGGGDISGLALGAGAPGDVTVAWLRSAARVSAEAVTGAGTAPVLLSTPGVAVERDTLSLAAGPDGRALAVWAERDADHLAARIMVARRPAGGAFGAARAQQTVLARATGTSAALQGGTAAAAWALRCPDGTARVLAATGPSGGRLGRPEVVSGAATDGATVALAIDAGHVSAAWTRGLPPHGAGTVLLSRRR